MGRGHALHPWVGPEALRVQSFEAAGRQEQAGGQLACCTHPATAAGPGLDGSGAEVLVGVGSQGLESWQHKVRARGCVHGLARTRARCRSAAAARCAAAAPQHGARIGASPCAPWLRLPLAPLCSNHTKQTASPRDHDQGEGFRVVRAADPPGFELMLLVPGLLLHEVSVSAWDEGQCWC